MEQYVSEQEYDAVEPEATDGIDPTLEDRYGEPNDGPEVEEDGPRGRHREEKGDEVAPHDRPAAEDAVDPLDVGEALLGRRGRHRPVEDLLGRKARRDEEAQRLSPRAPAPSSRRGRCSSSRRRSR